MAKRKRPEAGREGNLSYKFVPLEIEVQEGTEPGYEVGGVG